MSRVYLPNQEQFERMNAQLANIATALGTRFDVSTWAGVQQAVRAGVAPQLLPVGTQLTMSHDDYGDLVFTVVAHDYLKSVHDANAHTMTLLSNKSVLSLPYDSREAFYYAESGLRAGTYSFTVPDGDPYVAPSTYYFTLPSDLPVGGQLHFGISSGYYSGDLTMNTVVSYDSYSDTTPSNSMYITRGTMGSSLGTFGVELNHIERCVGGSNNYQESVIRQYLNSSDDTLALVQQTKFDRHPAWNIESGFMWGLDSDVLSVIGTVLVPCATNTAYSSPDSTVGVGGKYAVADKFYLASENEIFHSFGGSPVDDSKPLPFYTGATDTDYIKYSRTTNIATSWLLRSENKGNPRLVRNCDATGVAKQSDASSTYGVVPMCTIV